ncbi:MAG TPA: ferritin [Clostridiales bacterium]|jgi:ferritin|nr:ferritin [Clostridiales bacterium]
MLTKEVSALLNEQINKELYSAYLYLDMANYYADEGLDGFANWFYVQAQEERDHAMLIRTYLQNNEYRVTFDAIAAPDVVFDSYKKPLEAALAHEQLVTASINNIYQVAVDARDYRTMEFLNWFIKEQGEEEKSASDLIRKYELFGNDPKSLYLLDQELGARTYVAPTLVLD